MCFRDSIYTASKVFYKKRNIVFLEPLPDDKPVIFVGNHQCTFNDPVLLATQARIQPAFMTRADVFKKPLARKFFNSIRMMPIYRQRDGADFVQKNEEVFNVCVNLLEHNREIVIFGEGSHSGFRRLRHLKKGFARIGFAAMEKAEGDLDIRVIPVGFNYEHFVKMGRDLTITYGEHVHMKDYWALYEENPNKALVKIKKDVQQSLQKLMIHIPSVDYYEEVEKLRIFTRPWLYDYMALENPEALVKQRAEQKMIDAQTAFEKAEPEAMQRFADKINHYHDELEQLNFRNHLVVKPPQSALALLMQFLLMLPFLPFYLFGLITNYLPYQIPVVFAKKNFKDEMYHSSIRMTMAMFLYVFFWFVQTLLVLLIFKSWWITLLFFVLMPLCGWFAFKYYIAFKKAFHQWRYLSFSKKNSEKVNDLQQQQQQIIKTTQELLEKYPQTN